MSDDNPLWQQPLGNQKHGKEATQSTSFLARKPGTLLPSKLCTSNQQNITHTHKASDITLLYHTHSKSLISKLSQKIYQTHSKPLISKHHLSFRKSTKNPSKLLNSPAKTSKYSKEFCSKANRKGYLILLKGIQTIPTLDQCIVAEADPTDATNKTTIKLRKLNKSTF